MATDVTMPRLSDSMEEGTILKWIVEEGGEVKRGEPLCEIETDKANMTYEADTDGTLIEIVVAEGETVALGEVIARVGEAGEASGDSGGDEAGEGDEESAAEEEDSKDEEEPAADEEEDSKAQEEPEPDDKSEEESSEEEPEPAAASGNGSDGDDRAKASPVARRVANELGIDIADVQGSGPGGRILKADVEKAAGEDGGAPEAPSEEGKPEKAEKKKDKKPKKDKKKKDKGGAKEDGGAAVAEPEKPQPAGDAGNRGELQVQELSRLQRTVSRRMAESKATAPDFALEVEIDMSLCVELRARLKEVEDHPPSFNDMVVKACANALREHPRVNAAYRDGKFELYSRVNVGVAVAANDALVVPTVYDADKKSLGEISRTVQMLATKVRDAQITPPELSGGTFTVSNLGMYGIDSFTAVINPPQAALLAVGALKKKAVVDDGGRIVARDMMSATLVCDHRILYGADGAKFLARVRELLEQPLALAL
jgi:pyruvate dehydrogenase E2 component (dihydrolipoyllysine-residue acetyltransferase)